MYTRHTFILDGDMMMTTVATVTGTPGRPLFVLDDVEPCMVHMCG